MLYKPLVTLFMALAAAGGVAAAMTPVRRGNGYGPNTGSCASNTKNYCCKTLASTSDLNINSSDLLGLAGNTLAGLNCSPLVGVLSGTATCAGNPVCCSNVDQTGLINLGCNSITL